MFSSLKNDFIEQLMATTPPSLLSAKTELEQWMHGFLSFWLANHDLVTREEFDLQVKRLNAMQTKFEQLELDITQLENKLKTCAEVI